MKKLLLSFLPLLLVVLCGANASAQDFSATVTWGKAGAIKVYKGSNPSYGTPVEIAADATSFTATEKADYCFVPTDGYFIESATIGETAQNLTQDYNTYVKFYKLQGQYQSTKFNGTTTVLTLGQYVYDTEFTLDVNNGADKITFNLQDGNGNTTRVINPEDGKQTIKLSQLDKKLYMKATSGYPAPAFYSATINGTDIPQQTNGSYLVDLTDNANVYVAFADPALANIKYQVKLVFTNNNPECINNIRDWTNSKFITLDQLKADDYTLTVPAGCDMQINLITDCTFNSISVDPESAVTVVNATNRRYKINGDVTITIDATTTTYQTLETTVYTTYAEGISFSNSTLDTTVGDIKVTKVGEKAAGTVTLSGITVSVPTTEYTLSNISGKYGMVFFEIADGYYLKQGVVGNPEDKTDANDKYITGASAFKAVTGPAYFNIGKINNTASAKVFYYGPESNGRLRAKFQPSNGDAENASFEGLDKDGYLVNGWNEIKFDPSYDNYFEVSLYQPGESTNLVATVVLDGETLSPAEDNLVYTAYIKDNSVLEVFYSETTPEKTTVSVISAGDAHASLTYNGITTSDFATAITAYNVGDFVLTPAAGTTAVVNGTEATLANGSYTFKPAGNLNKIQLLTSDYKTFDLALDPKAGAKVKSLSSFQVCLNMYDFMDMNTGEMTMFMLADNAADWITAGNAKIASIEMGEMDEMTGNMPINVTLAEPITTAGEVAINIPAGVIYETMPNADYSAYARTAASRVNAAVNATITIDPTIVYAWTFDPEANSENELPEDNLIITLSLPEVKTLTSEAFAEAAGPWITYNGNPIKYSEDLYETAGWTYTQTMATWGKPALAIEISKEYFTLAGELTIKADVGAFTVNGAEGSPAIDYAAKFGKKAEYTYEFTPAVDTEINDWSEFTLKFPEAQTVAYDEDNAYIVLSVGYNWGTMNFDVTVEGNTVTIKPESEGTPATGRMTLRIGEGTFVLDGTTPCDEIAANWSYVRNQPVNFEWQASPTGTIVNEGWGFFPAIVYDEAETVNEGSDFSQIVVKWNDQALPAIDYENEDVMGFSAFTEGYNAVMFEIGGGDAFDPTAGGKLSVSIPAGALSISGQPNPEAIEYTWTVVPMKEYEVVITPADGDTLKEFSEVTVEFTNAETAELSENYNIGWFSLWQGYSKIANATAVEAVAGAEHPTFKVTFETVTEAGEYRVTIGDGAFYLDNAQVSEWIEIAFTVDPNFSGLTGIEAEDGLYTVYNLQGILVINEGTADDVKSLPAGIYIVNGKKVAVK